MARLEESNPLSPRSAASLNCLTLESDSIAAKTVPSPIVIPSDTAIESIDICSGPPSSHFESIVDSTDQEERPSQQISPSRLQPPSRAQASPIANVVVSTVYEEDGSTQQIRPRIQQSPLESFPITPFVIHDEETFSERRNPLQTRTPQKNWTSPIKPSPCEPISRGWSPRTKLERLGNLQLHQGSHDKENRLSTDHYDEDEHDAHSGVSDDTCFSAFSAIPNADMTLFADLGNRTADNTIRSPTRRAVMGNVVTDFPFNSPQSHFMIQQTPRSCVNAIPYTSNRQQLNKLSRSPSPTPRRHQSSSRDGDTTNLLLDFTQQFEGLPTKLRESPSKRCSPPKSSTEPNLLSYINCQRMPSPSKGMPTTPGRRNLLNLLDFDLPPQPTPRSIPTITIRELESLKSTYLSEISSLKASLSGREAEVESLKKAVGDAERRVGEALETMREEHSAREHAEKEKGEWEKKGKEVENVLNSVREEFLIGEREKEDLQQKLEVSNQLREDAELRAVEAATRAFVPSSDCERNPTEVAPDDAMIAQQVAAQLDEKMENLARELHAVYKKKHESKVATLKKTYELRSEKKHNELQQKIEELSRQNGELHASKDATSSRPAGFTGVSAEFNQSQKTELEEQRARIAGLTEEVKTVRKTHAQLLRDLERERVEKGELVAAVDEMLALQSDGASVVAVEDLRRSISRPAAFAMRAGGAGESRIGRIPVPGTAAGGPARIINGGKSKMMSNIERMGSGRNAD